MMRIAVLDDILSLSQQVADWSGLAARAEIVVMNRHISPAEAAAALAGFDIICTLRERLPFPRDLLESLPRLRYLCVTGKRFDTVDVAAASQLGILVSNTPVTGPGTGAVTELTWGLILAGVRHIADQDHVMRAGGWQTRAGTTLRGKKLGIVGLGSIGTEVARIGLAFGMQVAAWSPNLTVDRAAQAGVQAVSRDELFGVSDVVSLHLSLADSTRHVVGEQQLRRMKRTAWLVNTARAGLVDESALIGTLQARSIAGAALDVFESEPLPHDHPLRTLGNVLLTPHLGYMTVDMLANYYGHAIRNIEAFLDGSPIGLVNSLT